MSEHISSRLILLKDHLLLMEIVRDWVTFEGKFHRLDDALNNALIFTLHSTLPFPCPSVMVLLGETFDHGPLLGYLLPTDPTGRARWTQCVWCLNVSFTVTYYEIIDNWDHCLDLMCRL